MKICTAVIHEFKICFPDLTICVMNDIKRGKEENKRSFGD